MIVMKAPLTDHLLPYFSSPPVRRKGGYKERVRSHVLRMNISTLMANEHIAITSS